MFVRTEKKQIINEHSYCNLYDIFLRKWRKLEKMGVTHFLTKETSLKRMQLQLKNIIGSFCQKEVML